MKTALRARFGTLLVAAAILLAAPRLLATPPALADHPVSDDASLRAAILAAGDGDTITFTTDITLTSDLPAVQSNVTIDGQGHTLSGDGTYRGFFIGKFSGTTQVAVSVAIHDLTITNAQAHGGNGGWGDAGLSGGGGAGLGGAIFVANLANLTISNLVLDSNNVEGGAGGVFSGQPGIGAGGGGMGGDGGHSTFSFPGAGAGAGGGLGRGAKAGQGNNGGAGSPGIATGAAPGGNASSGNLGGAAGGGGGSGTGSGVNAAGGGGIGGTNGVGSSTGGNGGYGGGGGGIGGNGGYGGGGAGGGGRGGFGGGGGAGTGGTAAGFGAGAGGATAAGGGAALGGALFVQDGGSLTIEGNLTLDGNTLSAGPAVLDGVNGSTFGSGIFVAGNGTVTFNAASSETQTITNDIADQTGSGGTGPDAGSVALTKNGSGTLVLSGTNSYTGATTINAGTLMVNGATSAASAVDVKGSAVLAGSGTIGGSTHVESGGHLNPTGVLHVHDVTLDGLSTLKIHLHGTAPGSHDQLAVTGGVTINGALLSIDMDFAPTAGDAFTLIDNDGSDLITGTFATIPDGFVGELLGRHVRVNYGNDVTLTVLQETPTLSGSAPASVPFGNGIADGVTIANAFNPTGTVTFRAYGPADATCAGAAVFTSTTPLVAGSTLSGVFTPASTGVYRWTATYSGDVNNTAAATACGGAGHTTTITKADQTITFGSLSDRIIVNSPFDVFATASSALGVTFTPQTPGICSVTSGGNVALLALGTCTIAASQIGDGNYNAAPVVSRSFTVLPNCAVLALSPLQLPAAIGGRPYSQTISLLHGAGAGTFTFTGTLPSGLSFANGTITGVTSGSGVFPIAVTATDANACQVSASITIPVSPERRFVVGAAGGPPAVRTLALNGTVASEFDAYASGFHGGVSVAQGDVNGDGVPDIVTGAGPGGGPHIRVFDGATGAPQAGFFAFTPSFSGGVEVATGDVTGDGVAEILTTRGCAAPFVVRAFNGVTGALVREYTASTPTWSCGLHIAAGDLNGDGLDDLIIGAGGPGAPFVVVFDAASGNVMRQFLAYDPGFTGGVYVAAGDVTGDGVPDIITGAGAGGGPHVRVFDGVTGNQISGPLGGFMAYAVAFAGGVRVAAGDLNGDGRAEVITAAGPGGGPHVRVFDGATGNEILGLFAFTPPMTDGVFVAAPPPLHRMAVDLPAPSSTSSTTIRIAGWAFRQIAVDTVGTDAIDAWAYPVGGGAPIFINSVMARVARSDIATFFGGEFLMSGFDFTGTLAPGTYDLVVFARNVRTQRFDQLRIVRVTVN